MRRNAERKNVKRTVGDLKKKESRKKKRKKKDAEERTKKEKRGDKNEN